MFVFESFFFAPLLAVHSTPVWVTACFALLLAGLVICLALEEVLHAKKSVIAGIFAIICLAAGAVAGILPFEQVVVGSHEMVEIDELHGEYIDSAAGDNKEIPIDIVAHEEDSGESEHEPEHEVHIDGERLGMPPYVPGIDWSVIVIILGSSLFVDVTSKTGLFTWIAIKVTKASTGDPLRLLFFYGIMTVVFSAVLNNVTAMIIVGSLTVVSLEKLKRREQLLGFLVVEGLLTNIGGLLTLISSVPNIIVGAAAGITFLDFFVKAAPYVFVATLVTIIMGARLFGIKSLSTDEQRTEARDLVGGFDENDGVENWGFFYFASVMLCLFIVAIASTSFLPFGLRHLGMGFVAMTFAGVMLVRYKSQVDQFYKNIDWDLLGFFMCLFVVIYVMEHAGVLTAIGTGVAYALPGVDPTGETPMSVGIVDSAILLWGSAIFSSVTDNIPLSAMLANILEKFQTPSDSALWWSVIFGANLGGNLTPIGSASTLVAVTIMHKHKLHMSFIGFVKIAFIYAMVQLVLATVYVLFILPWIPTL